MSFHQILQEHAWNRPDGIALVCSYPRQDITVTYRDLFGRAVRMASRFDKSKGSSGPQLLLADDVLDFVVGFIAIGLAGGVPVPLAPDHVRDRPEVLRAILKNCGAEQGFTAGPGLAEQLAGAGIEAVSFEAKAFVDTSAVSYDSNEVDIAFLQYTSGSTGAPKGVVVRHENLLANVEQIRSAFGFHSKSIMGSWLPPYHDMGLIGGILTPLVLGIPTVLMSSRRFAKDPLAWFQLIDKYRVTVSGAPNFAYDYCIRRISMVDLQRVDLSSWRVAFNGAEPVRAKTMTAFADRFGSAGFDRASWLPCYGLAEATLLAAGKQSQLLEVDGVLGMPTIQGTDVQIVDPDSGEILAPGKVGEVCLAGDNVTDGYWRPESHPTPIPIDSHVPESIDAGRSTWLRTGDLGFLHGGRLFIRGRIKDVIIVRGRNHYPEDIEATLALEVLGRCAVVGVEGLEGEEAILLYEERLDATPATKVDLLRARVAERHGLQLADAIRVDPKTIPMTTSGKVRRRACRELYKELLASGRGNLEFADRGNSLSAVLSISSLSTVAADVIGVEVDAERSLVGQGLDSVGALQLAETLSDALGWHVPAASLMKNVSLHALQESLARSAKNADGAGNEEKDEVPLTLGQQSIWLQQSLARNPAVCNLGRALRISGRVDTGQLVDALMRTYMRHDAFRLAFVVDALEGQVVQRVTSLDWSPNTIDARDLSETEIQSLISATLTQPFNLAEGDVFRARIIKLHGQHLVILVSHHLVADVCTMGLVMGDIVSALVGDESETQVHGSFLELVRSAVPPRNGLPSKAPNLRLPGQVDVPSHMRQFEGVTTVHDLDEYVVRQLIKVARELNVTLPVLIFALLARALAKVSEMALFRIGWVQDNRDTRRALTTAGYFVGLIPLEFSAGDDAFADVVALSEELLLNWAEPEQWNRSESLTAVFAYQQSLAVDRAAIAPVLLNRSFPLLITDQLKIECVSVEQRAAYFPLSIYAAEFQGRVLMAWERDVEFLDEDAVQAVFLAFMSEVRTIIDSSSLQRGERS